MSDERFTLEIQMCGMSRHDDISYIIADTPDEAEHWDVELRIEFPDGDIEPLVEKEGLTFDEAEKVFENLEDLFPHADTTIIPE